MSPVYIGVIYSSRAIDTHTYNHKHTLSTNTQTNTYFRKILEGFVSNNGHDRFSTPPGQSNKHTSCPPLAGPKQSS